MSALLTERDVASLLNISVAALRRWRYIGSGPTYIKIGAAVRYDPLVIERWIASCATGGSNEK